MMQINIIANSYIQFNVSVYANSIIKRRGHSKFEKHAEMSMTPDLAGNLSITFVGMTQQMIQENKTSYYICPRLSYTSSATSEN